jgi:hypothetical protein
MPVRLLEIVQPPGRVRSNDWAEAAGECGLALPSDYLEILSQYGSGQIDDFLWLLAPGDPTESLDLCDQLDRQSLALRQLRGDEPLPLGFQPAPELVPHRIYPEDGGLIPWLITDNGDVVFWKALGSPDQWTIVAMACRADEWSSFEMNADEWLHSLLTGAIEVTQFPESQFDREHTFRPAR